MTAVRSVLVIGGGTVGNACAILLRRAGIAVDLVEVDPEWSALGSGITLQGNALRVLDEVGVWPQVREAIVASPTPPGHPRLGGDAYPGVCGMHRPTLQKILTTEVRALGAHVRLGVTFTTIEERDDQVEVAFTDGTTGRYDLVIGADGIHSAVRSHLGIDVTPQPTGMAIWRVCTRRPAEVGHGAIALGVPGPDGPFHVTGINPTSATHLYAYVVEDARDRATIRALDPVVEMRRLTEPLAGHWPAIRADITDPAQVDYRLFEYLSVPWPWNRGRVLIVGDAAHACPPTLAQGAAQGLEDASVLAQLLTGRDEFDDELLDEFRDRRVARAAGVVDASVRMCDLMRQPGAGGKGAGQGPRWVAGLGHRGCWRLRRRPRLHRLAIVWWPSSLVLRGVGRSGPAPVHDHLLPHATAATTTTTCVPPRSPDL